MSQSLTLLLQGGTVIAGPMHGAPASQPAQHVAIRDDTIAAVEYDIPASSAAMTTLDATGCYVISGLIDLHVHGAMGSDTMDADPAALARMARFAARHGVTAFLPTTMTASPPETLAAVRAVAAAGARPHTNGAAILGVHLEGPYISPDYPGAQAADAIRPPDPAELKRLVEAGPVRMITLAPEQPGALDLIRTACAQGIIAVTGHTGASYEQCEAGIAAGITQATHTYNAMTGLHHRRPGTLGSVLTNPRIDAQLIADNIHVHPAAMQILAACKGAAQTILITDAMRAAGLPPGEYDLGGQAVHVANDECRLANGALAGSVLTLEKGLANFMAATGLRLDQALPAACTTAARALGIQQSRGQLAPGYTADLVLVDASKHNASTHDTATTPDTAAHEITAHATVVSPSGPLEVVATVIGGRVVYLRDPERLRPNRGDHNPDGPGSF